MTASNLDLCIVAIKLAVDQRLTKRGKFEVEAEELERLLNDEEYEKYINEWKESQC